MSTVNCLLGNLELSLDRMDRLDFVPLFVLSIDSSLRVEHRLLKYFEVTISSSRADILLV